MMNVRHKMTHCYNHPPHIKNDNLTRFTQKKMILPYTMCFTFIIIYTEQSIILYQLKSHQIHISSSQFTKMRFFFLIYNYYELRNNDITLTMQINKQLNKKSTRKLNTIIPYWSLRIYTERKLKKKHSVMNGHTHYNNS